MFPSGEYSQFSSFVNRTLEFVRSARKSNKCPYFILSTVWFVWTLPLGIRPSILGPWGYSNSRQSFFLRSFFIVFVFNWWINSDTIFWENAPFAAYHCCCFCVFVFVFLRGDIQIPRHILFWEVCQFADFPASDIRILVVSHLGLTFWQSIDVSILIFRSHLSFCVGSMSPS